MGDYGPYPKMRFLLMMSIGLAATRLEELAGWSELWQFITSGIFIALAITALDEIWKWVEADPNKPQKGANRK